MLRLPGPQFSRKGRNDGILGVLRLPKSWPARCSWALLKVWIGVSSFAAHYRANAGDCADFMGLESAGSHGKSTNGISVRQNACKALFSKELVGI
jgi:hypothetical protein